MPLSMAEKGKKLKVIDIFGGNTVKQRLSSMGIYPNAIIEISTNELKGSLIISVNNSRIGMGRGIANKVIVEPI